MPCCTLIYAVTGGTGNTAEFGIGRSHNRLHSHSPRKIRRVGEWESEWERGTGGESFFLLLPSSLFLLPSSLFLEWESEWERGQGENLLSSFFLLPSSFFPLPSSFF